MQRYRAYGQEDDQPLVVGDEHFIGVDEYSNPENVQPAYVQQAVNADFTSLNAETRGGFVCLPELGKQVFANGFTSQTFLGSLINVNDGDYANGYYVMGYTNSGGSTGGVMYSANGTSWTDSVVPLTGFYAKSVAYGGVSTKRWVAVGNPGLNGSSFYRSIVYANSLASSGAFVESDAQLAYSDVCWANDKWVAVGTGGVGYSADGASWTESTANKFTSVAYGSGVIVAVKNSIIYQSTDAVTWTQVFDAGVTTQFVKVRFGGGKFVVIGSYTTPYFAYSTDGANFTLGQFPGVATESWNFNALAYGNGLWIVAGAAGTSRKMFISNNGAGWQPIALPTPARDFFSAVYGANQFIIGGQYSGGTNSGLIWSWYGANVFASGIYSDPSQIGTNWVMLLGNKSVGFYAFGHTSRSVSLDGYSVSEQSTIVQANNYVYIFRGDDQTPLYWNGDWNTTFTVVPNTTLPATYNSVPNSNQATYYQNRLWVRDGKDSVAASDVLAFTDYDPLANEFNLNTGNSDYVVATFPFAQNSLICFKNKSIELMQNVEGSLSDVTVTEITRQVGLVGINAVTSVGPDLAYVSYGNINLLTLTTTNNSLQHKTLPLSARIRRIMNRVNWNVGYKISIGYWNNKIYVSLPLDNSLFCNAVVVYNFINESWYGEWNFSPAMNMCIQGWAVNDYLGLQRLHAITEDGRIFVTDEGQNDISGTTVSEISFNLVTRAYHLDHGSNENRGASFNHFQRRMYADLSTNRPQISIASYTDGASEESTLLTNQTYTRSQSWLFNDDAYDLTNANNDYNRAYRRDYSTGPASVQTGSGFLPEMRQDIRIPLITRRQGRLSWLEVSNTQGYLMLKSIGFENRAGQRSSYVQA